ncbi:acetyl-CoA carboxylase carboxyltransferase subunit alpha, partial [Lactobacillus nasalidis]
MTKAMDTVRAARASDKLSAHYLREHLFSDFMELHGDHQGGDDPAIVGGLALLSGQPVTVITTSRGHNLDERLAKHFGQPEPSGYRKAARLVKEAARFKRPVLLFIDTAGAFPGKEAEYAGQGQAIAQCLTEIGQAATPIISVIFGEGGSGGALALACGDEVWMLENSMYSVLSPEGFASILWKDAGRAEEAADLLGLTPDRLLAGQVIEGVIAQGADKQAQCAEIKRILTQELAKLQKL